MNSPVMRRLKSPPYVCGERHCSEYSDDEETEGCVCRSSHRSIAANSPDGEETEGHWRLCTGSHRSEVAVNSPTMRRQKLRGALDRGEGGAAQ